MTRKIAVLGANGQVGAEVCLLLAGRPGVELVPVCRNRLGSAFLRYSGLAVRHGDPARRADAPRLLGDCDAVLNFALAMGRPRQARETNRRVIEHAAEFSRGGAVQIYFSTMSVYGDPRPGQFVRWQTEYGREKLRAERDARRTGRRSRKPVFILRLGHVCGDLQGITLLMRQRILAGGAIRLTEGGRRASNTVHTATIADAVERILAGAETPGTYDLMSRPQWSWREVHEHEARSLGVPLDLADAGPGRAGTGVGVLLRPGVALLRKLQASSWLRGLATAAMARLPAAASDRAQAVHFVARARSEVASVRRGEPVHEMFDWVPMGRRFLATPSETASLLAEGRYRLPEHRADREFPPDLPGAGA